MLGELKRLILEMLELNCMKIFPLEKHTNWLKTNKLDVLFSLLIFVLTFFIAFKNFSSGTYLTGWDNLHPEFNFQLNIERSLNAVWQEYQGVGVLGGMSHAADLPRQLFLWGVSFIVPESMIRYFWTFLMLFSGPLGVYFLLRKQQKIGAFTASIFYIFNLATVQYFFVPFETFIGFYGFLPWLIYFAINYLNTGKKLWKYALVSIFATCAFYVQTLFLVYGIFLFVLVFKNIKRGFKLLLVTFLINAFWLLPALWFSFTSSQIPINSDINKIATPETVLMNHARNDFVSISNLKGYWFDYYDFGKDNKFDYLFKDWIGYSSKPYIKEIGVGLFIFSVLGLILNRQVIWLILLVIGYLMLTGYKLPFSILEEAFRNSFTKWSVAFAFVISLGLGYFTSKLHSSPKNWLKKLAILPAIILICAAVYTTLPILNGRLISQRVRVNIPTDYFEAFNWFNNVSDGGRVAFFPAFDKWGWNYHDWGYGGSGFVWYGIKNPVFDRAFNVWSPFNEGYYKETTKVILDNDIEIFANTLSKYQVKYLFIDDSIVYPWGEKELLKLDTLNNFINNLNYKEVFKSGLLTVYDTEIENNNFISAINGYSLINTNLTYSQTDPIHAKYGNYIQNNDGLGYPFVNFDPRGPVDIGVANDQLLFTNKETISEVKLEITDKTNETFEEGRGFPESYNCDLKKNGEVYRENLSVGRNYKATNGGVSCDYFAYPDLSYKTAYVLRIKGQNIKGRSLKIYLYNWETKRVELEELMPTGTFDEYFVIYPKNNADSDTGSGYTLNVETRSFGRIASENTVEEIEFIPFDLDLVQNLYIEPKGEFIKVGDLNILETQKVGTAFYKIKTLGNGILQLGQGYEKGWIAISDNKILEHVKINSWSNGWIISADDDQLEAIIWIIFWPQLLEWVGLLLLGLTTVHLIVQSKK
jgi:hypothetical protein